MDEDEIAQGNVEGQGPEPQKEPVKEPLTGEGISIDLISTEKLDELGGMKIRFILDAVKQGRVLVLERGLSPSEELELIQTTMSEIDHESFIGVETPGFTGNVTKRTFLQRVFGRSPAPRMMVVGPAALLRTIKKDGRTIQAIILTGEERSSREDLREVPIPSGVGSEE